MKLGRWLSNTMSWNSPRRKPQVSASIANQFVGFDFLCVCLPAYHTSDFFFLVKRAIKESIRPVCRERRKENSWGEGRILLVECVALTLFYIKIWCGVHYRNVEIKSKGLHPSSSRFFLCFHLFSFPSFLPSSLSLSLYISFSLPLWCGIVSHQASSLRWCLNPPAAFRKNLIRSFYEECPLTLDVSL